MKKFANYLYMALIALMAVGFTSCGDDEPKGGDLVEKLQGTWNIESMKVETMGQTIEMDIDDIKHNSGYNQFYDEVLRFDGEKVNGQPYTVKGNKLLLPYYENEEWWMEVSFKGSNMTLYMSVDYQGINMKMWATYSRAGRSSAADYVESPATSAVSSALELIAKGL